ncbi:peptidase domain-containing ABC transporter [Mycolicibacterium aubagnense]|nr:peptidase domain-containing ABC transporter [Mycolicibacterium aubagnense]WGI31675.1 peptidase domain-containing ABC transporter [Mycolicibacterium aubagnense]
MSISEPPAPGVPGERHRFALLELMPADVRRLVEASFHRESYSFGEVIVAEGDAADAMYMLESGTARVIKTGDQGEEVPLNVLHAGDAFGERALLAPGGTRTATVRASGAVVALRLDKAVFDALVFSEPAIAHYLDLHVRRHELRDFLRAYTAFSGLPAEGMRLLLEGLTPMTVPAGHIVIRQGDPPGPMYIVRAGRLRAYFETNAAREQRAYLRQGDFFGEVALLRGSTRTATVEAVTDADLWTLPPAVFVRLSAEFPAFRKEIEQRISSYDYLRTARVPLDFAEELLPAQAGPDALAADQTRTATAEFPQADVQTNGGDEQLDGSISSRRRIRRFPSVLQVDEMDCGAASLASVCHYYGRNVSITRVREAVHTAIDGTSLLGIARGAEALGLAARTAKVSKTRLDEMPLPAIVHWDANHWLVLYDVGAEHVRLADPARGRRKVKRSEFESKWSGFAAFFTPTDAFAQTPQATSRVGWLVEFFRPYRRVLVLALVLALLAAGADMLIPVLSKYIVDGVIQYHDASLLTLLVAGMFGALVLSVAVTLAQRYFLSRIAVRIDRASLDTLSERLLALPMSYFNARRTGDISRRLNGLRQVRTFIVEHGVAGLASAAQLLVAVIIMFVYSWRLALVYLATAPLYGGLMWFSRNRLRPAFDVLEESWGKYQSRQIDSIKGIETVKAMGAEESLRRLLLGQFNGLSSQLYRADLTVMTYQALVQVVTFLSLVLFLWIGALQVMRGHLTIGELVSFNALVLLANGPVLGLLWLWDQLQYSTILLDRLNDILEQEPEQGEDHSSLTPVPTLSGRVRFARVTFEYPGPATTPILDEIDFEVEPGTRVAIVGRSGSGKTTLVKCLSGLLLPTAGTILFDGADLTGLHLRQLRRHIGFVLQDNHMFDASIAENIALGDEDADSERIIWAARVANAAEFIERLPLGYETKIGESGMLLSGGQRQRIAIARAVYPRPPVLVFDEATSALDTESERAVKENLDELLEGRTSFVIAHRLSTVRDADVILVLEKGRLVERGTHDELMARQGLYYYLCSQQLAL